jgi:hypothetical protein
VALDATRAAGAGDEVGEGGELGEVGAAGGDVGRSGLCGRTQGVCERVREELCESERSFRISRSLGWVRTVGVDADHGREAAADRARGRGGDARRVRTRAAVAVALVVDEVGAVATPGCVVVRRHPVRAVRHVRVRQPGLAGPCQST